ncbi:MAG: hypothetical protein K6F78_07020 [Bacteroidaceae bacterium]|nr:hypothetical protein [Bacteroidaceae bacterium]
MTTEDKNKRVVQIEIDDEVKKLTVEGVDKDAQVVLRQELDENELNEVAAGNTCSSHHLPPEYADFFQAMGTAFVRR